VTPDAVSNVRTRDDFVAFVRDLAAASATAPEAWENLTLPRYLDALAKWVEDCEGFYGERNERVPEVAWTAVAQMLTAATVYE
jgi:hypothetical protein